MHFRPRSPLASLLLLGVVSGAGCTTLRYEIDSSPAGLPIYEFGEPTGEHTPAVLEDRWLSDEDCPWVVSVEHEGRLYTARFRWQDWGFKVGWRAMILDIENEDGAAWLCDLFGRIRVALPQPGTCLIAYRGGVDDCFRSLVVNGGSPDRYSRDFDDWEVLGGQRIWRVDAGRVEVESNPWSIAGVMPEASSLSVHWYGLEEDAGLWLSVAPGRFGRVRVSTDGGPEMEVTPAGVEQLLRGRGFRISLDDVNGQVSSLDVKIRGREGLHLRIAGDVLPTQEQ